MAKLDPFWKSKVIASDIANLFYDADKHTRNELLHGRVNLDEPDYLSTVFARIRDKANIHPSEMSYTAQPNKTQKGDGLIVFRFQNKIKVALVESKLIRNQGSFDWKQPKTNGNSHFYAQIVKHQRWGNKIASFAWFSNKLSVGTGSPPMDGRGSTCIWSSDLYGRAMTIGSKGLWTYDDLIGMSRPPLKNLKDIVEDIILCRRGTIIEISPDAEYIEVRSPDDSLGLEIPVPFAEEQPFGFEDRSTAFLTGNQLGFYSYLDFTGNLDKIRTQ